MAARRPAAPANLAAARFYQLVESFLPSYLPKVSVTIVVETLSVAPVWYLKHK